jgi:hypothetical protein
MRRVAVIHDWLTGMRGGEQVLEGILQCVPEAEVFTLFHFPGTVSALIESRTIHTSSLQSLASKVHDYRKLLPLFPRAARQWDLRGFDTIISSSHCVAKGVNAHGKPHLCYCHTPMRYIWDRFDDYFPRSKPLQRAAMSVFAPWLRRWDVRTVPEVTQFVANSRFVRDRIARHYARDAEVIAPFVDEAFLGAPMAASRTDEHVIVSALVPYKKVELAIAAVAGTARKQSDSSRGRRFRDHAARSDGAGHTGRGAAGGRGARFRGARGDRDFFRRAGGTFASSGIGRGGRKGVES